MPLHLAIFESANGRMLADWSARARNVEATTNEHGFATLTGSIDLPMADAFYWFDRPGLPWMELNDNADLIWRGRLEDARLVTAGVQFSAVGAWSALGDIPYTMSFSPDAAPEDIVIDIVDAVTTANPGMISDSTALIESPGTTVYDEIYTDADMRQILTRLARLGDDQDPPRRWEVGFWEGERLHFRPRGSAASAWYVDASDLRVDRSLSQVWNSVYTRYDSGASVTATESNAASITRYGVTRRRALSSRTTDSGAAGRERDAALADGATPIPRASIALQHIFTAAGTPAPLHRVRSGDTITLRNLPPEAGMEIDRIRTFLVSETRYRCDDNTLEVVPESPIPGLDILLARALEVASI